MTSWGEWSTLHESLDVIASIVLEIQPLEPNHGELGDLTRAFPSEQAFIAVAEVFSIFCVHVFP